VALADRSSSNRRHGAPEGDIMVAYLDSLPVLHHCPAVRTPEVDALRADPTVIKWSGDTMAIPAIGAEVHVRINSIGRAIVIDYFAEHGWFGLLVRPLHPPAWFVKQNGREAPAHVFGNELRASEPCPKCGGPSSHTCKAECLHCDAESCAHAWFPGQPDTSPASYKRHLRAVS
jgi:hypothetical protein